MVEDIKDYITSSKRKVVRINSPSELAYNMMSAIRVNLERKRALSSSEEAIESSSNASITPLTMPEYAELSPGTKVGGDDCMVFRKLSGSESTTSFLSYGALLNVLSNKQYHYVSSRIPLRTPPGSLILVDLKAVARDNEGEVTYLSDCRRNLYSHWRQQSLKHLTRRRSCKILASHLRH
jgi:hypothetical protein